MGAVARLVAMAHEQRHEPRRRPTALGHPVRGLKVLGGHGPQQPGGQHLARVAPLQPLQTTGRAKGAIQHQLKREQPPKTRRPGARVPPKPEPVLGDELPPPRKLRHLQLPRKLPHLLLVHRAQLLPREPLDPWPLRPRQPFGLLLQQRERGELKARAKVRVLLPPRAATVPRREVFIELLPKGVALGRENAIEGPEFEEDRLPHEQSEFLLERRVAQEV